MKVANSLPYVAHQIETDHLILRPFELGGAEVARAVDFDLLGLDDVVAFALPGNAASMKVMARDWVVRRTGTVALFGLDVVMADIDAAAYRERQT